MRNPLWRAIFAAILLVTMLVGCAKQPVNDPMIVKSTDGISFNYILPAGAELYEGGSKQWPGGVQAGTGYATLSYTLNNELRCVIMGFRDSDINELVLRSDGVIQKDQGYLAYTIAVYDDKKQVFVPNDKVATKIAEMSKQLASSSSLR